MNLSIHNSFYFTLSGIENGKLKLSLLSYDIQKVDKKNGIPKTLILNIGCPSWTWTIFIFFSVSPRCVYFQLQKWSKLDAE